MRWLLLSIWLAAPAAATEQAAEAFWDALLGCWAVKGGALPEAQGWELERDWTATCGDCAAETQIWNGPGDLRIVRERMQPMAPASCVLATGSQPAVEDLLPSLARLWSGEGLGWIAEDLARPAQPFAVLLSCEADVDLRKVAVVDASGGILKFVVTGWQPDRASACAGVRE
ncbi:hypothetical protein [Pseudaestuariivita sp.]|uniref:hypothetical protein n=1 Tax=Pseudaestuariivita sp. TaxID=2211669 RepID=UPI00405A2450